MHILFWVHRLQVSLIISEACADLAGVKTRKIRVVWYINDSLKGHTGLAHEEQRHCLTLTPSRF